MKCDGKKVPIEVIMPIHCRAQVGLLSHYLLSLYTNVERTENGHDDEETYKFDDGLSIFLMEFSECTH